MSILQVLEQPHKFCVHFYRQLLNPYTATLDLLKFCLTAYLQPFLQLLSYKNVTGCI